MNVLFHSWMFPPGGGGIGAYIHNMGRALAGCGHRVLVITGRAEGYPEEAHVDGITIWRKYDAPEIGSRRVAEMVLAAAHDQDMDVIEGADCCGDCARLLSIRCRPPILIKVHSCNVLRVLLDSQVLFWWQRPLIRLAVLRNWRKTRREALTIRRAALMTAPSRRIFQELSRQGVRLPEARAVIPNPCPPMRQVMTAEARSPTLLMVGRMDIGKGIHYLPVILGKLVGTFPDLVLEIAGGDSYARGLGSLKRWLTNRFGDLMGHVRFLGQLGTTELEAAYRRAWLVILPSRWDTFPTVLLEAMSFGKPVVTSPHGGMPEMLENTLCHTAPPDSDRFVTEIARLLSDPDFRKSAGNSLLSKARDVYSAKHVVDRYVAFLHQHVGRRLK